MRRGKMSLAIASAAAVAFIGSSASGQVVWTENFDSYANGSGTLGQGGWTAWDGDAAWDSFVSNAQSNSPSNSLDVNGDSDSIYQFNENHGAIDCGSWSVTTQAYIPGDIVGAEGSWFILLNLYEHGLGGSNNWSTQVRMDPATGNFVADFSGETLPLIFDTWFEIRVDIDLDNDTQTVTIGGTELYSGTWTDQVSGGGQLELQAMDLFAYGTTSVFYDDFQLEQTVDCAPAACMTLEVDRLVAGAKSTFTMTDNGVGSNGVAALVYGTTAGTTNVNDVFGYCASFGIKGVNQNKVICQGKLTAGEKTCGQNIPGGFAGVDVLFQTAMRDTCPDTCMSEVLAGTIQ